MKSKEDNIRAYEARLLKQEPYLRRAKRVAFGLAIVLLVSAIASQLSNAYRLQPVSVEELPWGTWMFIGLLLASAYGTDLKLKHIDSLKLGNLSGGMGIPTED